jgi:hypothetical protein
MLVRCQEIEDNPAAASEDELPPQKGKIFFQVKRNGGHMQAVICLPCLLLHQAKAGKYQIARIAVNEHAKAAHIN